MAAAAVPQVPQGAIALTPMFGAPLVHPKLRFFVVEEVNSRAKGTGMGKSLDSAYPRPPPAETLCCE